MLYWDPNPDFIIIPILGWPIKWYGLLFALGFAIGIPIFRGILFRYFSLKLDVHKKCDLKKKTFTVTDKIIIYVVLGTVIGARLGHFIFYETPSDYLNDPFEIFRMWNGGLASHGAAIGIILALYFFGRWARKIDAGLTSIRLLDFICVPTALAGFFIRIGNFVNQEILGTTTSVSWAVVFGHPADRSLPIARHPVQLYEAFFYLVVFFVLWRLTFRSQFLLIQGRLIGLFLILVFGFRFVVEFFKLEQSLLLSDIDQFTMGQWLSVPFVAAGGLLILFSRYIQSKNLSH